MDNIDVFRQRRSIINEFYSIVKKYSHKFRFIFITGVTRYSDINIFSGFNNILDISMEPEYGTLVGYTDEELDKYFSCHIENAANVFGTSVEDIRNGLRLNYDGYCFDRECRTRVYNTWSVLNFLDDPSKISGYQRYWFNSGGISTIIVSYLKSLAKIPVSSRYGLSILEEKLRMPISVDINELTLRSDHPSKILPEALLFQTGYLSISGADGNRVSLAIPNEEVRCSLRDLFYLDIMSEDSSIKDFIDEYQRTNIINMLYSGNEHDLKEWIAAAFNTFSYESKVLLTNESLFRDFIYSIVINKQIFCSREEPSGRGRADLITHSSHMRYR